MRRLWMLLPVLALTACFDTDKPDDDDDDDGGIDDDFGGGIGGGTGGDPAGDAGGDSGGSGDDAPSTTFSTGMHTWLELGGYDADCYAEGETRIAGDGTFAGTAGCDTEYGWIELRWTGQIDDAGTMTGAIAGRATNRDVSGSLLGTARSDDFEAEFEADGAAYNLLGVLYGNRID
jgi:hypothetical protein